MAGDGYVRQSSASIQPGEEVTAAPLNNEFNTLQDAFNASTGHSHDGSTGNAPPIDLTTSVDGVLPQANGGTGSNDGTIDFDSATFGEITIDSTSGIHRDVATSSMSISGGTTGALGANIVLFGETHGTTADDILFRTDTTQVGRYDASAALWTFTGAATFTGNVSTDGVLTVGNSSGNGSLTIDSTNGSTARFNLKKDSSNRFSLLVNNANESGSNAGSNFRLVRYSDAGSEIDTPLYIERSTGNIGINDTTPNYKLDVGGSFRATNASEIGDDLTVDGDITVDDTINMVGAGYIKSTATDQSVRMSGGSTSTTGANIVLYGPDHVSVANDILFRSDATSLFRWDDSQDRWEFSKDMRFQDSDRAEFGNAGDMAIYHDGTSRIFNYTGNLTIDNKNHSGLIQIRTEDSGGTLREGIQVGGGTPNVVLYYGGDQVARTRSNGFTVQHGTTPRLYINDESGSTGTGGIDARLLFSGPTEATSLGYIGYPNNDDFHLQNDTVAGHMILGTPNNSSGQVYFRIGGTEYLRINNSGIHLRDNIELWLGTDDDGFLFHNNTDMYLQNGKGKLYIKNTAANENVIIQAADGSGVNHTCLEVGHDYGLWRYDGASRVQVNSSGGTLTGAWKSTGNFTAEGNLYVGKNGGGDSNLYFYDDNSNANRRILWDDSNNFWRMDDSTSSANWPPACFNTTGTAAVYAMPFGHIVDVAAGSTNYNINASVDVKYSSSLVYGTSGTDMAGTWRSRGRIEVNGSNRYYVCQRVA